MKDKNVRLKNEYNIWTLCVYHNTLHVFNWEIFFYCFKFKTILYPKNKMFCGWLVFTIYFYLRIVTI